MRVPRLLRRAPDFLVENRTILKYFIIRPIGPPAFQIGMPRNISGRLELTEQHAHVSIATDHTAGFLVYIQLHKPVFTTRLLRIGDYVHHQAIARRADSRPQAFVVPERFIGAHTRLGQTAPKPAKSDLIADRHRRRRAHCSPRRYF